MLRISEIFKSIEGEGIRAGYPCIFIRLHGCNLRCSYCDSMYAVEGNDYTEMTVQEVWDNIVYEFGVSKSGLTKVTLTGGEPLIHKDTMELVNLLLANGCEVNIETNGACDISPYLLRNVIITMDWKSISSGMNTKMNVENLRLLRDIDVIKFVVGSIEDLDQMKKVIQNTRAIPFVSSIFGEIEPKDIVQYLLDNRLDEVRMQLQMHKFIWNPDKRGV